MMAAVFATGFALVNMWVSGADLVSTLFAIPLFFLVMLLTMRATNRVAIAIANRIRPPQPEPEPIPEPEPSSDRPEHAQRRRRRRRRRRRGGRRRL
jgi:hypothetical protein